MRNCYGLTILTIFNWIIKYLLTDVLSLITIDIILNFNNAHVILIHRLLKRIISWGNLRNSYLNVTFSLQTTLTSASQYLFSALDSRAFIRSATVILPSTWPDSCVSSAVLSGSGESSDITVLPSDPARGKIWTQQSFGCGRPGDQIYIGFQGLLTKTNALGKKKLYLVKKIQLK